MIHSDERPGSSPHLTKCQHLPRNPAAQRTVPRKHSESWGAGRKQQFRTSRAVGRQTPTTGELARSGRRTPNLMGDTIEFGGKSRVKAVVYGGRTADLRPFGVTG